MLGPSPGWKLETGNWKLLPGSLCASALGVAQFGNRELRTENRELLLRWALLQLVA